MPGLSCCPACSSAPACGRGQGIAAAAGTGETRDPFCSALSVALPRGLRPCCYACSSCWLPISRPTAAHWHACLQSLDEAAELFEADDPLLAECAARVLARAGQYMRAHCEQSKREVPKEVSGQCLAPRAAASCADATAASPNQQFQRGLTWFVPPPLACLGAAGGSADGDGQRGQPCGRQGSSEGAGGAAGAGAGGGTCCKAC